MPLFDLVNYFNQRFIEEYGATENLLFYQNGIATGSYHALQFGSQLNPVVEHFFSQRQISLDAQLSQHWHSEKAVSVAHEDSSSIINLDRLIRTVHILNFLPLAHEQHSLFLPVSEHHVINIRKDHGAYFSDILLRCGLETKKVIITVKLDHHSRISHQLILSGLKNYRERGYEIALSLDANHIHGNDLLIQFLKRLVPDYIRLPIQLFYNKTPGDVFGRHGLMQTIRRLDTVAVIENIRGPEDMRLAETSGAHLMTGDYAGLLPTEKSSAPDATGIPMYRR